MQAIDSFLSLLTLTQLDLVMILVCMGLFFVLWKILDNVFFSRYLPYLEHREQATSGNMAKATNAFNEAKLLTQEVEVAIKTARNNALSKRAKEIEKYKESLNVTFKSAEDRLGLKLKQDRATLIEESDRVKNLVAKTLPALVNQVRNSIIPQVFFGFFVSLSFLQVAHAEDAHGAAPGILSILYPSINLVIFVVALYFLLRHPLAQVWKNRRLALSKKLEDVTKNYQRAQEELATALKSKEILTDQLASLEKQISEQTASDIAHLQQRAEERIYQLEKETELKLARQSKYFSEELMNKLIEEVLVKAEKEIMKSFDTSSDEKVRTSGLQNLAKVV
jgi:F0F1-type ATP synthase membrane subunit b/b'